MRAHINGLPIASAFQAARIDHWAVQDELAAQTVDALNLANYYYASAHGADPSRPPRVPRPSDAKPELPSIGEIANFLKG